MITPVTMSYKEWIPRWTLHIGGAENVIRVPPAATTVTPLVISNWLQALASHPNKELTSFFTTGLSYGFCIGYSPWKSLKSAKRNLECALDHPGPVLD